MANVQVLPDDSRAAAPDIDDADGEPEDFARAIAQAEFGGSYNGPRCVLGRLCGAAAPNFD